MPSPATAQNTRSIPMLARSITLHTDQAQFLYSRTFERAAISLYKVSSVLQIFAKQDDVDAALSVVIGMIESAETDLGVETAKLERLITNQAIEERPIYTSAKPYTAPVSSPLAIRLVRLAAGLDKLVIAADTLWLYEFFNDQQRNQLIQSWQSRLMRLNRRLVDIERRAILAARRAGAAPEAAVTVDQDADSATDAEGIGDQVPDAAEIDGQDPAASAPVATESVAILKKGKAG